ncbi:beta-propeller domain-containing protein [Tyzzerella sp. OttesenSCG-928-J15]|nr:beta-propeller domain-containing protein [Tyzzerella sp. OttesenSCG-928-J15]
MSKFKRIISAFMVMVISSALLIGAESKNTVITMKIDSSQAIVNGEYVVINEKDPSVTPIISEGKTYVPVEFINANFNTTVDINKVKAMSVDDTVFVPLRELVEAMGYSVYFKDSVIVINSDKNAKAPEDSFIDEYNKNLSGLPTVGSKAALKTLLGNPAEQGYATNGIGYLRGEMAIEESADMAMPSAAAPQAEAKEMAVADAGTGSSFSATNTQVQGVDEGDIIKTDGKYIYFSPGYGDYVSVVKASPANDMVEAARIETKDFIIDEMYLNGTQLVLITRGHKDMPEIGPGTSPAVNSKIMVDMYYPYYGNTSVAKVFVYDLRNIENVRLVKTFEIDGNISNTRKVGENLYVISSNYLSSNGDDYILPTYKDSANSKETALDLAEMCYLPEALTRSVTTISGIRLNKLSEPASMTSYLGNSGTIYMSKDNLYITTETYDYSPNRPYASTSRTNIYKFSLDDGKTTFAKRGKVDGNVLNQFSMDEYDGHFRIATTTWTTSGNRSNNMFVLDSDMNKVGQLTNIAPNENIYSVRFMGDKAHMVTFEVVDPLFVIDLSKPEKPAILGELKIPGYSVYLHPYDENHLIGFGYDTVEINGSASMRGLKLSMFDVSDLANPKEKFTTVIGDSGTYSELLNNHKVLMFNKEKNVLAFPIEVRTLSAAEKNDRWAYGKFAFQGAYVYSIDMEKGFVLDASISNSDKKIEGDYNEYVQRIIYINDTLYTASNNSIVSTNMKTFEKTGSVDIN